METRLRVEVSGRTIVVALRGTCLRSVFVVGDAPWLICQDHGPDDPEAPVTKVEFRAMAWKAANEAAKTAGLLA